MGKGITMVTKDKNAKEEYFSLPKEDRLNFEIEVKQKKEKEIVVEKVFKKLNEKYKK